MYEHKMSGTGITYPILVGNTLLKESACEVYEQMGGQYHMDLRDNRMQGCELSKITI